MNGFRSPDCDLRLSSLSDPDREIYLERVAIILADAPGVDPKAEIEQARQIAYECTHKWVKHFWAEVKAGRKPHPSQRRW